MMSYARVSVSAGLAPSKWDGYEMAEEQVTVADVKQDLLQTQIHLLKVVREGKNQYQTVAAAQAFALLSGTLTSSNPIQPSR